MTKQVQRRRGTATQHTSFTGAEGEISVNTTNKSIHVHDGTTAGGIEAARADMTNVTDANLNARLNGNTLSSLTITSADINGGTIDGTVIGGTTPAAVTGTTITGTSFATTGNMTFGDNDKAIFGAGSDLQIYHDGTNSYVSDQGQGVLYIQGSNNVQIESATGENMAVFLADNAVELYYDNVKKFNTTNTGVDVTGTITSDGLTVDGNITATGGDLNLATLDLNAIAATKAVTATDVFVYDTSKDSDGGAWRKRCQHTSWYNETLNTTYRGGRREFPAVAVIVTTHNSLTIYDGDDPSLPMWMYFNESTGVRDMIFRRDPSCVAAINGIVAMGAYGDEGYLGLARINFIADTVKHTNDDGTYTFPENISERDAVVYRSADPNDDSWWIPSEGKIINNSVNDVAMTVLPDAPIDPATGLQVPTIAVATAGGVSVIRDDGTVVDITATDGNNTIENIAFLDTDKISFYNPMHYSQSVFDIPTSDVSVAGSIHIGSEYRYSGHTVLSGLRTIPASNGAGSIGSAVATNETNLILGGAYGVSSIDRNETTPSKGMVAYTTSTYNTGWMNGDTKGAFLSDTDDTDLVASGELVTNGTFDSASNWTIQGDAINWTISGGVASGSAAEGSIYSDSFATVVDKTYVISFEVTNWVDGQVFVSDRDNPGTENYVQGNGSYTKTFVAEDTSTYINLRARPSDPFTGDVDNISVKLADADRSVNNKGLIVNGTVTRSPVATGADLVAYSGFSASNYLEQPYNSALDFGTGDFCVMGWARVESTTAGERFALRREDGTTFSFHLNNNYGSYFSVGSGGSNYLSGTSLPLNIWKFITFVRRSGVGYLYQDGALNASANMLLTVNNATNPVTYLGVKSPSAGLSWLGSLALWRISATAPTAEQISRIYNDEKHLFTEGAQATLAGTSDAVTALAHDSSTGLLHVGSSYGRSVFQGLRRVSNTTTAVGTAISASNGLVVEE